MYFTISVSVVSAISTRAFSQLMFAHFIQKSIIHCHPYLIVIIPKSITGFPGQPVCHGCDNLKLVTAKRTERMRSPFSPKCFHKILFTLRSSDLSSIRLTHSRSRSRHYISPYESVRKYIPGNISVLPAQPVDATGREGRAEGGGAACRLLSWTRDGITDYSLSRPICQAARTTRSQALYCKIKWLARVVSRCIHTARHTPPIPDSPNVKYRSAPVRNMMCVLLALSSKNYVFFHIAHPRHRERSERSRRRLFGRY